VTSSVDDCRLIELPRISRAEGTITPVESGVIPFDVARIYYLYDVPGGAERGGHGHRELQQLIVAIMGAFTVVVDDGERTRTFTLNRGYHGLYVPRQMWRDVSAFSSGGICLVLASLEYSEDDYIRDYDDFLAFKRALRSVP
jgi:hypothetical protein